MTTSFETSKAMRGTKRVCPACEARFYDLERTVIVCPSCGAPYTPAPQPLAEAGAGSSQLIVKSRWRGRGVRSPGPTRTLDPQPIVSPEVTASAEQEEEAESAPEVVADDEIVLEQEADDADISGLIDHEAEEPNEQ
jgi:uncharacterized protein (TIGR02300 family)